MAYIAAAVDAARRAAHRNLVRPAGRIVSADATPRPLSDDAVAALRSALALTPAAQAAGFGLGPQAGPAGTPAQAPRGKTYTFNFNTGGANYECLSRGPMPYPWRLVSLYAATNFVAALLGLAITQTPGDNTGSTDPASGSSLVEPSAVAALGQLQHYFLPGSTTVPLALNCYSPPQPAGTYISAWSYNLTGVGPNAAVILAGIEYDETAAPAADINLAALAGRGYATGNLSAPRGARWTPPRAVIISGPGFRRTIPWASLDTALKTEIQTNAATGTPTPGAELVY